MPNLTRTIVPGSDLHRFIATRLESRYKKATTEHTKQKEKWKKAEERTLAYLPEVEADAIRRTGRENGRPAYTTIQLPYSYAQLMTAHTYLTSVFFARTPIHQFSGRHGEGEQQVQALEALINYQVIVGKMLAPYYIWMYDGPKYGVGILGTYWDRETIQYGKIDELIDPMTGGKSLVQSSQQVPGYEGNRSYNVSPFDFKHDPRVPLGQFQRGEFVCVDKKISWNDLLRRQAQGYYVNIDQLDTTSEARNDASSMLERPHDSYQFDEWDGETKQKKGHPALLNAVEMYVDLVPSEWKLGASDYPEKWVFTSDRFFKTFIGAQPLGAVHGEFPFDVIETEVESYGTYNRGMPEILDPIQQTMDWLINSHFFNVRAALNNQFIADPSRIVLADAEKSDAGFIWRLRPEAYGTPVEQAIKQFPVADVTTGNMNDLSTMFGIGERVTGISDQLMGMLSQGGRKTAAEIRTSTGFGISRLKTIAEYISATAFASHATKLWQLSQQYYTVEKRLKIAGDSALLAGNKFLMVTPADISGQFDYETVDGTLPIDRFAQVTMWKEMMAQIYQIPQVAQQYDFGKIFAWVAQLGGLKNINQFRIQLVPDAQMLQQAQMGNSIPMTGESLGSMIMSGPTAAGNLAGTNTLTASASAGY